MGCYRPPPPAPPCTDCGKHQCECVARGVSTLPNIGLCGYMRSGKDTIADYLIEKYGYKRLGFAQALKEEVARGVGCTPAELNEEPLRSQVRPVLQIWGTEFRRAQDPNYWTNQASEKIDAQFDDVPLVFNDVRFHNEIAMLRSRGFVIIKVDMPGADVLAYAHTQGIDPKVTLARLEHASEREWQEADFDVVIPSVRGNLQGLYDAITRVVEEGARGHFSS